MEEKVFLGEDFLGQQVVQEDLSLMEDPEVKIVSPFSIMYITIGLNFMTLDALIGNQPFVNNDLLRRCLVILYYYEQSV